MSQDYYDSLAVSPEASPQEIREAYFRLKSLYQKDSPVFYSLVQEEDVQSGLKIIEEAFNTLSDPQQRRKYDEMVLGKRPALENDHSTVVDLTKLTEEFRHDFEDEQNKISVQQDRLSTLRKVEFYDPELPSHEIEETKIPPKREPTLSMPRTFSPNFRLTLEMKSKIMELFQEDALAQGMTLRKMRDLLGLRLEDFQNYIKVSPDYILALEEEKFQRLPALVYTKGFLRSYLRFFGLTNPEQFLQSYLKRFEESKNNIVRIP